MSAEERKDRFKNRTCYKCQEKGHLKCDSRNRYKPRQPREAAEEELGNAGLAMMASPPPPRVNRGCTTGAWIVDSGASHHRCGDANILTDVRATYPVSLTIADGTVQRAVARGTAVISVLGPRGATPLTLHDVLVLPGMEMSLFSVKTAARRGSRTVFKADSVLAQNAAEKVLMTRYASGGAYALQTSRNGDGYAAAAVGTVTEPVVGTAKKSAAAPVGAYIRHQRFSHAGVDSLLRTLGAVDGMQLSRSSLEEIRGEPCDL